MFSIYLLRSVTLVLCFCFSTLTFADSFGLTMGMASHTLDAVKDDKAPPGMLRLLSVPKSNDDYKTYLGQFSDGQGLCWTKGIGIDIPSDQYGTELRSAFSVEILRLAGEYGEPKEHDFRFSGRADSDLEKWMEAVSNGDRYVAAIWESERGANLPENIQSVGLVLNAYKSTVGFLSLEYTFANIELCEQELSENTTQGGQ